jgi:hypothetical protein
MTKCELHDRELLEGSQEIRWGLPLPPPDGYLDDAEKSFPNSNSWRLGGCVIDLDSPARETVKYCPACREAEKAWQDGSGAPDELFAG